MSDFIHFEAETADETNEEEEPMSIDANDFIDDTQENDEPCFYRFHNQTRDTSEIMKEILREEEIASEKLEPNNYLTQNEIEDIANETYDETDHFLKSREKFLGSLLNPILEQTKENSFYLTLLYAIRYSINKKCNLCDEKEIEKEIGSSLHSQLCSIKDICILDLNHRNFEEMCFKVNDILTSEKMFLRVYEIKDNYRYLFHEDKESKKVLRSLSSCIKEKFNGFTFADLKLSRKQKTDLFPISILYTPVKKQDEVIKCYFTKDLRNAYRSIYRKIQKNFMANTLYKCYYCNEFWVVKSKYEKHLRNCGKKPGVIYNFNLKNVVTFEENLKYIGDLPFSVYADFETTAPTADHLSPDNKEMFAVSYSLLFEWHPNLNLPRQMIVRGYNHSLEELSDMTYLTAEQLALKNQTTTHQLQDCLVNVHAKRRKNALAEKFNIELKFACDILMRWFRQKIQKNVVFNDESTNFKRLNPITSDTECVIYNFPLSTSVKGLEYKENKMSYLDFLIRKEYAFLKNIFDEDDLKQSNVLCTLENYWQMMKNYTLMIKTAEIELQSVYHFSEIQNEALQDILYKYFDAYGYDVPDLIESIKKFKVDHHSRFRMSKYSIQLYSFFYDAIMNFPTSKFDEIKTVSTNGFIINLYRVINFKVHIHHSHVTGQIIGYSHDFCNWKIRESNYIVPLIGHNFLGFDIYYMVKGYRASVWETTDLNMGGTNLTNMNYANISNQIKIIDTIIIKLL